MTVAGFNVMLASGGGWTRSEAVAADPTEGVAVIVSVIAATTILVAIVMDWLVLPAVNGTGVCGEADGSELVRVTV
jgi:hypothetical protein